MFGIGLGEILLIVLVTFLVAPKEIPIVLRKLGQFFGMLSKLRDDLMDVRRDVEEIMQDPVPDEMRRKPRAGSARSRPPAGRRKPVSAPRPAASRHAAERDGGTRSMRGGGK
ncbi:MAG: hypothetical protein NTU62_01090 [Spirochaetes bacterium]|nr:hypothetical protein [Spirochaetota bacterium]